MGWNHFGREEGEKMGKGEKKTAGKNSGKMLKLLQGGFDVAGKNESQDRQSFLRSGVEGEGRMKGAVRGWGKKGQLEK